MVGGWGGENERASGRVAAAVAERKADGHLLYRAFVTLNKLLLEQRMGDRD